VENEITSKQTKRIGSSTFWGLCVSHMPPPGGSLYTL
jgi:hypothetical protein